MPRLSFEKFENLTEIDPIEVVRSALAESGSLARFMEVHYLASEPELFAIMQVLAGMTLADRSALAAFLKKTARGRVRLGKVTPETAELIRNTEEKS
jgi:hypothetical protein